MFPYPEEFYAAASEEDMPAYRVELAKSGRSKCKMEKSGRCALGTPFVIPKGSVRIGSIDQQSGAYARWVHLECWRVPAKVHQGLPHPSQEPNIKAFIDALLSMDEVLLTGMSELSEEHQVEVAIHCMNTAHWARISAKRVGTEAPAGRAGKKRKTETEEAGATTTAPKPKPAKPAPKPVAVASKSAAAAAKRKPKNQRATISRAPQPPTAEAGASTAIVPVGGKGSVFVPPRPGVGLAVAGCLSGKTVVFTGLFPELGGGAGLDLGKAKARALVESFGGRVTGAISGKTDILLVGKEPGMSKEGVLGSTPVSSHGVLFHPL